MKRNIAIGIVLIIVVSFSGCTEISDEDEHIPDESIEIACWNLQIFGTSKAGDKSLVRYYANKLDNYDISIIQEIRDSSGTAIQILAEEMEGYDYIISDRAGQSTSKEQYAIFYNNEVTLRSHKDYTSSYQDKMQRPPLKAKFDANNGDWDFTIYTIHTQPSNVDNDLDILEEIVGGTSQDTIIIGDLNADGSYYDEDNIEHFTTWEWVLGNEIDTTVSAGDNTYDRIIINDNCKNNFIKVGVMDNVDKDQSDHYLVYGIFNPEGE